MTGFFIKKSFFDGWDNLLQLILINILYIGLLLLGLWGIYFLGDNPVFFYTVAALFLLLFSILSGGVCDVCRGYSEYRSETWRVLVRGIRRNLKHSLFFFLILSVIVFMFMFSIPFYSSFNSFIGAVLSLVVVWILLFVLMALPYYFPLTSYFGGDGPLKTFKKCFIISIDNPGKSLFLIIHMIFDLAISLFTIGLIPGVSGVMLSQADMLKLLMKKYDYLEENPGADRKDIDWNALLEEERENIGPRSLKNMIFPWK